MLFQFSQYDVQCIKLHEASFKKLPSQNGFFTRHIKLCRKRDGHYADTAEKIPQMDKSSNVVGAGQTAKKSRPAQTTSMAEGPIMM